MSHLWLLFSASAEQEFRKDVAVLASLVQSRLDEEFDRVKLIIWEELLSGRIVDFNCRAAGCIELVTMVNVMCGNRSLM
jgi:hypothetical protein